MLDLGKTERGIEMRLGRLRPKRELRRFGGNGYVIFLSSFFLFVFCRPGCFYFGFVGQRTDFSGQLHERLQREGVKTHKERVEELNKYLSRLSEHHDMYVLLSIPLSIFFGGIEGPEADLLYRPKIGPG